MELTGISIVICCYNSAQRLPPTLAHLADQKVADNFSWEVIVVDNASTDNTQEVAKASWDTKNDIPMRVVYEPQPGLSYARHRGFSEAKYELICFVDDDNWICPEWLQIVWEIMSEHQNVGACGGCCKPVSDVALPSWFPDYEDVYAVGKQTLEDGDVTDSRGFLWGAGLTVRKQAWQELIEQGFQSLLTDRKGASLSSGGDYEFCLALRLAGWRLWYDSRLEFCHYIPAPRLQWNYVRKVKRAFGAGSVGLDPYISASQNSSKFKQLLDQSWLYRVTIALLKLLRYPHKLVLSRFFPLEGDAEVVQVEILQGRLSELIKNHKVYTVNIKQVQNASWKSRLITSH